ncbi:FliH/SctL family protein [Anaerovibrio sp. RM50]|uniref:FliH/SctL family protein n=1 Tax=Anaerovibrio sp. RM50 TaxID=1200557 RepID=UPI0006859080|nr:FliH/SctL family protein [Anaerovibrio sp. RM50]
MAPPKFERPKEPVEEETPEMSEEVRENIMANIRRKEEAAIQKLKDAEIAGEITRQEARAEAERIISEATTQADKIKEEAREAGHQEGFEAGRKEGMEQIKEEQHQIIVDANAKAENTIKVAQKEALDYVTTAENTIAEMVIAIANKVIPQHFIDVPQMVLPLVQSAIEKVKDQPQVTIRVCPDAYELVLMARTDYLTTMEGKCELSIESDETLKLGDVVVESPNGTIDAKLTTQLEVIEQSIRDVMK